jgi:hypothetical protein
MWIKQKCKNKFGEDSMRLVWHEPNKQALSVAPATYAAASPSVTPVTYAVSKKAAKKTRGSKKK